jgi:hypothetical protein
MPSKCGAHEKNPRRDAKVSDRTQVDSHLSEEVLAPNQRLWEKLPVETDAHRHRPPTPYASREFWSAEAFVHGCRIRPEEFVSDEAIGDCYLSSRELITKSHKLITASKQRIRRVNADMALRRRPGERIN